MSVSSAEAEKPYLGKMTFFRWSFSSITNSSYQLRPCSHLVNKAASLCSHVPVIPSYVNTPACIHTLGTLRTLEKIPFTQTSLLPPALSFLPLDMPHDQEGLQDSTGASPLCGEASEPLGKKSRPSLVAQWSRICLPVQERDTGSIPGLGRSHVLQSNRARGPQLLSVCPRACAPQQEKPLQ